MPVAEILLVSSKEDSVLNEETQTIAGKRKEISGRDWRLIHDGVKVVDLIEGVGITYTLELAAEFLTEEVALAEIVRLRLDDSILHPELEEGEEGNE